MRRSILIFGIMILFLSACASPTGTPVSPTEAPALTQVVEPTAVPTATSAPSEAPTADQSSSAAEQVVYKIIPGESQVSYTVDETFLNQNNRLATAVGITTVINGEVFADLSNPPASTIGPVTVDISQFQSDSGRRDSAIRNNWLESARFPIATFVSTQIEGLPESYVEGQDYPLKVTGDLTVREVTKPVTFDMVVRLSGDTLSGTGTTQILMSDFEVGPITIAGVLNTRDEVIIKLDFVARP